MRIRMKNNHILIEEVKEESVSDGGIILPGKKYNRKAIVIASTEDMPVAQGDVVIKAIGKGTPIDIAGHQLEMIHINSILGVIKNN